MESLKRFEVRSTKAKVMPLLEAVGSVVNVPRLRKRVRDDVSIQNARVSVEKIAVLACPPRRDSASALPCPWK
jgi:hypothetical protein